MYQSSLAVSPYLLSETSDDTDILESDKLLDKLSQQQAAFCREYITDFNASRAARRAGYSPNGVTVTASQLLARPNIKVAVQQLLQERAERTQITADRVIYELSRMAFANMAEYIQTQPDGTAYIDLSTLTSEQAAAIQEVTTEHYVEGVGEDARVVKRVKLKLHPKTPALKLLGQHLGILIDKVHHSGEVNVNVGLDFGRLDVRMRQAALLIAEGKASSDDYVMLTKDEYRQLTGGSDGNGNANRGSGPVIDVTPRAQAQVETSTDTDTDNSYDQLSIGELPTREEW